MQRWFMNVLLVALSMLIVNGCGDDAGGDTTKPVITLIGASTVTVTVGDTYTDAGATAADNVDGNITAKIVIVNNVNTSNAGTYDVTYNVKDTAGNKADEVKRTVTVIAAKVAFAFTSSASETVEECQSSVQTLSTEGAEGTVTYAISGDDAAAFDLNATTRVVTFKSLKLPDYETKNAYTFTATATDGSGETISQAVGITITQWSVTPKTTEYGCVPSPYTGEVWLDRNLGAGKVCDKSIAEFSDGGGQTAEEKYIADQKDCFGDYYQWGRGYDGHLDMANGTTTTLAADVNNPGVAFIKNGSSPHDWAANNADNNGSIRVANWSKTNGNSVCPVGYRVANLEELKAELFDENSSEIQNGESQKTGNSDDGRVNAYNTFLKLPSAGKRLYDSNAPYDHQGDWGILWAATAEGAYASYILFSEGVTGFNNDGPRAYGTSVRCLRD
jgi:hypothetical protein